MASKTSFPHLAFFFLLNLLFFTLVTATYTYPSLPESKPPPQPTYPDPNPNPNPNPNPYPSPNPTLIPPPTPKYPSTHYEKCPKDVVKIGICAKLLNHGLLEVILGKPPVTPCCTLIKGLVDLQAAVCLCTAIKASVLGIDLVNIPISLSLLANNCGEKVPPGFQCP